MGFGNAAEFAIILKLVDEVTGKLGNVNQGIQGVGASMTQAGKKMTMGLTLPIVGAGVAALKMASDFDASMRNVNAIAQLPEEAFAQLKTDVIDFSLTTRASSDDVAKALYNVVASGMDMATAFEVMKGASRAAGAGLASTTDTSKLLIAAMRGYGYEVDQVDQITDIFLKTVSVGITTLPELAGSLGRVIPMAANLGVSLEEVGFAVAQLTQAGLSTEEATTRLNAVFVATVKPSQALQSAIEELGYTSGTDMVAQTGGALEALRLLKEEGFLDTNEAVAELFPNIRAMGGVLALTNSEAAMAAGAVDKFAESSKGAVEEMRDQQYKSLPAQLAKLKSAFEAIAISVGTTFVPKLVEVVKNLVPMIQNIGKADPRLIKMAIAFAGVVAVIGPLLMILGTLITSFGTVSASIAAAGGILGIILSPIGLAIAALVGLKLAFDNNLLGFKDFIKGIQSSLPSIDEWGQKIENFGKAFKEGDWIVMKEVFDDVFGPDIGNMVGEVSKNIYNLVDAFKDAGPGSIEFREVMEDVFGTEVADLVQDIVQAVTDLFGVFEDGFVSVAEAQGVLTDLFGEDIANSILDIQAKLWEFRAWFENAAEWFNPLIILIEKFGIHSESVGLALDKIFGAKVSDQIQRFAEIFQTAWDTAGIVVNQAIEMIRPALEQLWEGIKAGIESAAPLIERFKKLWEALGPFFVALGALIAGIIVTVVGIAVSLFSGIAAAIQPFIETIVTVIDAIVQIVTGLVQFITGILQTIWGLITGNQELITRGTETFSKGIQNIWDGLKSGVIGLVTGLVETVVALVEGFYTSIVKWFTDLYNKIVGQSIIGDLVTGVIDAITDMATDAVKKVEEFVGDFIEWVQSLYDDALEIAKSFIEIGAEIVAGIREGISNAWNTFKKWLNDKFNALPSWLKYVLKMDSPSLVFAEIGHGIVDGLQMGIKDRWPLLISEIDTGMDGARLEMEKHYPNFNTVGKGIGHELAKGLADSGELIAVGASGIIYHITDAVLEALEQMGVGLDEALANIEKYWDEASSIFEYPYPDKDLPPLVPPPERPTTPHPETGLPVYPYPIPDPELPGLGLPPPDEDVPPSARDDGGGGGRIRTGSTTYNIYPTYGAATTPELTLSQDIKLMQILTG